MRIVLLLSAIVVLGAIARFWNLDWDGGAYTLHPDEWALNQVVRRLGPDLNPHFFFYGSLPIYLYRATADLLTWLSGTDWLDTSRVSLVGRFYSALASTLMLPVVFLAAQRLWGAGAGLIAAALAASAPLLIQAAHFGTVDTFVTLAGVTVLWLSLRIADGAGAGTFVASALVAGFAVATKLTALAFLLMPAIAYFLGPGRPARVSTVLRNVALFLAITAVVTLAGSPYYLLSVNELWAAIVEQTQELNGGYRLAYTWQFIGSTPYLFEGSNLLVWGVGLATGISAVVGWGRSIASIVLRQGRVVPMLLLVVWPTLYFAYIGTWEARFVRHTLPLVPFLCLFAAGALVVRTKDEGRRTKVVSLRLSMSGVPFGPRTLVLRPVLALIVAFSALWGLAFLSIYTSTDTRLAATEWFHSNVAAGTHVVVEDKDTLIPLPDASHPVQTYPLGVIEPTTPDSEVKQASIASTLASGEYLVISSRRWSATIPRLPNFPITARYYSLLFAGKLGYTPAATFASPPRLGPWTFSDDSAEETFQVFDHPTVRVLRNTAHLPVEALKDLLGSEKGEMTNER